MQVSESISNFLQARKIPANADLIDRWYIGLETQINVAAGDGEPVEGKKSTYTDGVNEWWDIRIPKNAGNEPNWHDYSLQWPLDLHADGIGLTGWDWQSRTSKWVGFDIDSLLSHAAGVGISDEELEKVKTKATTLPYIEVRRSTGGSGLHLYVYLDNIPTKNHTEHAALARCILGMMSSETGFNFSNQIDCCGGVMWIWHRKLTKENNGLQVIKPSEKILTIDDLPSNWKDHIEVVTRRRSKIQIPNVDDKNQDPFDALTSGRRLISLDTTHKEIIDELSRSGFSTVWVSDYHLLQTHTKALENLLDSDLEIKGYFKTTSEGNDPATCNCFCFPLDDGGWRVYRFSPGITEYETWEQDGDGWTNCYFNCSPDLNLASKAHNGVEAPNNGGYVFSNADKAVKVLEMLGQTITIPKELKKRETRLKTQKDGRVVISIKKNKDEEIPGWLGERGKLSRVLNVKAEIKAQVADDNYSEYDKLIRALVSPEGKRAGWSARAIEGDWVEQPKDDIKSALAYYGKLRPEIDLIVGSACVKPWRLVSLPFQPEYPGGRQWNKGAVQYLHTPAEVDNPSHPHWDMILHHCFGELTDALKELPWAQQANIKTGEDYGLAWIACLLREPLKPLPYIFLFGPENCGKSIFHESFSYLISRNGIASAKLALENTSGFNGELAGKILAYIEEGDISKSPHALSRLKEWVLSPVFTVRQMRMDAYSMVNMLHFIQVANDPSFCPVLSGDTRITMIQVPDLLPGVEVPRREMEDYLIAEAPQFMRTIFNTTLPPVFGRLRLPVVDTLSKICAQESKRTLVEHFIAEQYHVIVGERVVFKDFYNRFLEWLSPDERSAWSKQKVKHQLPLNCPTGVCTGNQTFIGNLTNQEKEPKPNTRPWILINGRLRIQ